MFDPYFFFFFIDSGRCWRGETYPQITADTVFVLIDEISAF